jgi:hypothetical protein
MERVPTPDVIRLTFAAAGKIRQVRDQIERGISRDDVLTTLS